MNMYRESYKKNKKSMRKLYRHHRAGHREAIIIHARHKIAQRFHTALNKEKERLIIERIKLGYAYLVKKQSSKRSIYSDTFEGHRVHIVFDWHEKRVVTMLYPPEEAK